MRFSLTSALSVAILSSAALVAGNTDRGVTGFGPSYPVLTFVNSGSSDRTYVVQGNSDNPSTAFGAGQSSLDPVKVPAGATVDFHPGIGFIGAFSDLQGSGTRHELNFRDPAVTWYNADMQFGMSNSTLGTTDGSKQNNGNDALTGEQDCLAKANAAWSDLDAATKTDLMNSGFLEGSMDGLTAVSMAQDAPASVTRFYQLTAEYNAYIVAGSVAGVKSDAVAAAADKSTLSVATNKLTITAYE